MAATFKILSLDGGGIRGLYTAEVLRHFEDAFGPISDHFDMICGTSTGGLIALALSKGVPAAKIVEFYKNEGPRIFPAKKLWNGARGFFRQFIRGGKYSNGPLEIALKSIIGDTQMSQAKNLLCIPSYNLTSGRPRIFKYPHPEGNNYAAKYGSMIEAALATSAAPTYFPVKYIGNRYYTDGGVWANNPVLCGIQEALEYFVGEDKQLQGLNEGIVFGDYAILSLGCLPEKNGWEHTGETVDLSMSLAGWRKKLINAMADGQDFATERLAANLVQMTKYPGKYVRIDGSNEMSTLQRRNISLDLFVFDNQPFSILSLFVNLKFHSPAARFAISSANSILLFLNLFTKIAYLFNPARAFSTSTRFLPTNLLYSFWKAVKVGRGLSLLLRDFLYGIRTN